MPQQIRMWEVIDGKELTEIPSGQIGQEVDLENWLESDISVLDENLLVIGNQVRTDFGGEIDLLCLDIAGDTVVVELKKGKSPRRVTAQALDYASWVKDLSYKQISDIAAGYARIEGSLEEAFEARFKQPLPDTLNLNHRSLIVAEEMDDSTERIVRYLSEMNVPINVATVQHFTDQVGREMLAQVFLVEPDVAEVRAQVNTKRRKLPNAAEMVALANERGVGELYKRLVDESSGILRASTFGNESRGFSVKVDENSWPAVLVVELGESDTDKGLRFRLNGIRLMNLFSLSSEQLDAMLPQEVVEMEAYYWRQATEEEKANWKGYRCYFRTPKEIEKFISGLRPEAL